MKTQLLCILVLLIALVFFPPANQGQSHFELQGLWQNLEKENLQAGQEERFVDPDEFELFRLDKDRMLGMLESAPLEEWTRGRPSTLVITLPMPDGSLSRFAVKESPIMEPGLAAKFPDIKTYLGQGIDEPAATTRFDVTPVGFRAIILSPQGTVYIEPFISGDTSLYASFYKDKAGLRDQGFSCLTKTPDSTFGNRARELLPADISNGDQLIIYRLAVAATQEYTNTVPGTGTVADGLAAITTTINRVNAVYERELAIRFVLVNNNDQIIFTEEDDGYTNDNPGMMLGENQAILDAAIQTENYDIGHVFSTGPGGIASIGVTCNDFFKGQGTTGLTNPTGEVFDVDYVAHEMGHQFSANHTFNGSTGNCNIGNYSPGTAFEAGSGSTIMGYAGICLQQNTQPTKHDNFHVISLEEMISYIRGSATCAVGTNTFNNPPQVFSVGTRFVPKETPFTLDVTANDADTNASLTYSWEEYDLGPMGAPDPMIDHPILRAYAPVTNSTRYFPSLQYVLDNSNVPPADYPCVVRTLPTTCLTGETLPSISRTMNFQVTVRDNQAGGGGIATTTTQVFVDGNSGPFRVTTANNLVSWNGLSRQTITWDVANTNNAPINAFNANIRLSTDGGQTFPISLANGVPNDGSHDILVPNISTTNARIKVSPASNLFFDINDVDITINQVAPNRPPFDFDGDGKTDISIFRPGNGQWWYLRSGNGQAGAATFGSAQEKIIPADFTGDGKTDMAFFKPTGGWYVLRSEDFSYYAFPFGTDGDIPAPGDFDGDGKADAAVYRPSTGLWFILRSSDGSVLTVPWGIPEDRPVVADYDGDGLDDIAVYRPSAEEWWILGSSAGVTAYKFGSPGVKAIPGDYTGDGKADLGYWNPAESRWYILRSEDNSYYAFVWGLGTDIPVPGDYDGDTVTDPAVWRPSTGTWYILGSFGGFQSAPFGSNGDIPVPSAYLVPEDAPTNTALIVTKTADTNDGVCDSDCSLREAIATANSTATDDSIEFDPGTFLGQQTIVLNDVLTIADNGSLTINGTGSGNLAVSGNDNSRVFRLNTGAVATINDLTVRDGNLSGIQINNTSELTLNSVVITNNSGGQGGGIVSSDGLLTLNNSTITGNTANHGGGIWSGGGTLVINNSEISGNTITSAGGGIFSSGPATIRNSTIDGNETTGTTGGGTGGGIFSQGTLTIIRSTVSNNTAGDSGGGIYHNTINPLNLENSTVSGNTANEIGGGIFTLGGQNTIVNSTIANNTSTGVGGGIRTLVPNSVQNSIIADNIDTTGASNDYSGVLNSQGYNLIEDVTGATINGSTTGNITGSDPNLGQLQDNGGFTHTQMLFPGSPAIDAGNSPTIISDQRGFARPFDDVSVPNAGDGSDIGAFERQNATGSFTVNKTADTNDGSCDADCSLREAIAAANANPADEVIVFDPAVFGTPQTITLGGSQLVIANNGSLAINGPGMDLLTVSGNFSSQVFKIDPSANASITNTTITEGVRGILASQASVLLLDSVRLTGNDSGAGSGGAIWNNNGSLTVLNSMITTNTAFTAGGIQNSSGTLIVDKSTISGNSVVNGGGGIVSTGTTSLTVVDSTISQNSVSASNGGGGGVFNGGQMQVVRSTISGNVGGIGGAIYHSTPETLYLENSTISGNSAGQGGGISSVTGTVSAANTTIVGNHSSVAGGGGVFSSSVFNSLNCIFADNTDSSGNGNDFFGTLNSEGFNLIEDTTGTSIVGQTSGNILGADPVLGPLQDNGGFTQTHALLSGSPAIDAGNSPTITSDQRGSARPFDDVGVPNAGDGSDIGAIELQQPASSSLIVTKTADTNDGLCDSDCSLREAIAAANADPANDVIGFDPSVFGTPQTITLGGTELSIDDNGSLKINGTGVNLLTVSGNQASRIFAIAPAADVTISQMTITDGNVGAIRSEIGSVVTLNDTSISGNSNIFSGSGVLSNKGTLNINDSTISNNQTPGGGGGVHISSGTLNINDSVIDNNRGEGGGGGILALGADSNVTIHRSTISNNFVFGGSNAGGGISCNGNLDIVDSTINGNTAGRGGGIYGGSLNTTVNLTNTTISGNNAVSWGGGISLINSTANVVNSTIASNTSGMSGGGVISTTQFNSQNSIFADNTNTTGGAHDFDGTLTSQGYNLIEDTTGTIIVGDTTGNITGVDPMLGPLQHNLGPTATHALLTGSPAIEKGNSPAINTDQRGKARPYDDPAIPNSADGSDIGAFERQASDPFGAFSPGLSSRFGPGPNYAWLFSNRYLRNLLGRGMDHVGSGSEFSARGADRFGMREIEDFPVNGRFRL